MDDENDICAIDYEDDKHDVGTESYERINRQYYQILMEYLIDQKQDARDELRIYEILDTGLDVNYGCAKEDDKPAECLLALACAERPLLRVFIRLLKMGAWIGNGSVIIEKLSRQNSVAAAKILDYVVMNHDVVFPNDFFINADMTEMLDTTIVKASQAGCLITCMKLIGLMEESPTIPKWRNLEEPTKVALISVISDLETSEVKPVDYILQVDYFFQNQIQDINLFISSGHVPCQKIPRNRFNTTIFRWCCKNGYRHLVDPEFISKMLRIIFCTFEANRETFEIVVQAILTTPVDDIPDVQEIIYEYSKSYEYNGREDGRDEIRRKYFIVSRLSGQTMLDGQPPRICPFSTQKFAHAVSKCIMTLKEYFTYCRHDIHPSELQGLYYIMKEYDPSVADMISEFASRTRRSFTDRQWPYPYPDVFLPCQTLTTEREYRNILLIVWIRDNPQISTIVPSTGSLPNEIFVHIIRFVLFL
jgi:hypothetical protein